MLANIREGSLTYQQLAIRPTFQHPHLAERKSTTLSPQSTLWGSYLRPQKHYPMPCSGWAPAVPPPPAPTWGGGRLATRAWLGGGGHTGVEVWRDGTGDVLDTVHGGGESVLGVRMSTGPSLPHCSGDAAHLSNPLRRSAAAAAASSHPSHHPCSRSSVRCPPRVSGRCC